MGHAIFVFGAAGAGKTTFCRNIREHGKPSRNIRLINLDPAYNGANDYDLDLYEYITVDEVMEAYDFGPNGALFHALQEAVDNLEELKLEQFENELFIFDCPGQIELFLHSDLMIQCIKHVSRFAKVAVVYLTDATVFTIGHKHLYTALCATLCMGRLQCPFVNILSKTDLIDEEVLEKILSHEYTNIEKFHSMETEFRTFDNENRIVDKSINKKEINGEMEDKTDEMATEKEAKDGIDKEYEMYKCEDKTKDSGIVSKEDLDVTDKEYAMYKCEDKTRDSGIVSKEDLDVTDKEYAMYKCEDKTRDSGIVSKEDLDEGPKDSGIKNSVNNEYDRLTMTIIEYIDHYSLQDYLPLNWENEDMVQDILLHLDHVLQIEDDK